jgi:tetratricopeptide (TPR) repeat protein
MRLRITGAWCALAALTCWLYAPNLDRQFVFDSIAAIQLNPAITSLDVARFFRDPNALTVIRENADYRPLLLVVNALNYRLSGTETWSWHVVQVGLHLACAAGLFLFMLRAQAAWSPEIGPRTRAGIAFTAAALLALHPTSVGVVNYVHARASLLVAVLLLPAFSCYLRAVVTQLAPGAAADAARSAVARAVPAGSVAAAVAPSTSPSQARPRAWLPWYTAAWLLYAGALLAKAEAVAALAVLALVDVITRVRLGRATGMLAALRARGPWLRLLPFALVTAGYLLLRHAVLPDYVEPARHAADVDGLTYLWTQTTVWWAYIGKWLLPLWLVADDLTYPVHARILAWQPLLATAAWLLVAVAVAWRARRSPWPLFGVGAYLSLLSPTSSVLPLAEMLNEHRPYLPMALLSASLAVEATNAAGSMRVRGAVPALAVLAVAFAAWLTWLSVERMPAYRTRLAYYQAIVDVAPSPRAHVNLGLELALAGRQRDALGHFRSALRRAPRWHTAHLNIAKLYAQMRDARAAQHFDRAVELEVYGTLSRLERGLYRLSRGEFDAARSDLRAALDGLVAVDRAYVGLVQAELATGRVDAALAVTREFIARDARGARRQLEALMAQWSTRPELAAALAPYLAGARALLAAGPP